MKNTRKARKMNKKINIPDNVKVVLETLYKNGFEGYLVGGCVRDFILGKVPYDYDITTNALPDEMKECFKDFRFFETGISHGTLTVVSEDENIEITTYRKDGEYKDGRRPLSVEFTPSLEEDLKRRDFTMNAIAYSEKDGFVDFFGGINDIENKVIKAVGNPYERFSEDKLRIMRGIRFSSELSFEIENETKSATFSLKEGLTKISAERISAELDKLLMGDNVYSVLMEYADVLAVVIPEIKPCIDFEQKNPYHIYTVWEHIAKAVEKSPKDIKVRLSMLFHDIGKPRCFTVDEKGIGHFKGHEKISAEMAEEILRRLKKSNDIINTVKKLVEMHYIKPSKETGDEFSDKQIRKILTKINREDFFLLTDVLRADSLSKAEFAKERLSAIDRMEKKAEEMYEKGECLSLKDLSLNGNDISALGYEKKEIGNALSFLLDAVISEKVINEREKLIEYLTKRGL